MNRARTVLASLRLSGHRTSTRLSTIRPVLTQVTQFSSSYYYNTHQKQYFSSKSSSLVELLSTNDWSPELETELENSNPSWTHETVIYVLKKLDNDPDKAYPFFNWVCNRNGFKPSSPLYSLMLRILVLENYMKPFWITLRKMKEEGFYIDEETYLTILGSFKKKFMDSDSVAFKHFFERMVKENAMDSVVRNVVHVVMKTEWSDEVEQQLGDMGIVLGDNFVIRVLKELRNYPLKALQFFRWVGKCEGYECNTITYNAMARVLGRDDSIGEFWSVVEEMKNAGHELDIDSYIKISRQFQKIKLMEEAVKLFEFMMDGPFKPSVQDCTILLRSISASDNPDLSLVFRVVKKYEAAGNSLSKAIYDGIHRSLTAAGKFDEAWELMKVMKNAGHKPDNITYSQFVFGLCKAKRLEEACKVLDEMEAHECVPDIKTWTILIQGHCAANELGQALMCFANMMEKNCDPDADLLAVLIDGFLSQNKIDGAYTMLLDMVNKARLRPWQATYKLLIEKLLEVRKLEEALNLLRLMKQHNHPPFPKPFVQYISKFGTVEDAVDFFKALSVKEYPSTPAYLHVFESFFKEGKHSEAKDLLFKCPHHIRKHPKISELFGSAEAGNVAS
ncbi:pentatricopeptide repeat-containing protein At3g48250, chloroplastic [Mercurialis annua]|uniref:pentatricopeptide repeat-containing protein At3g48250, chloroplastic n=1 Tax=Mercurialis annua TaxID=3986 RepID=UPI00215E1DFA|nr:pentatricopeptide repeat-containing protein At3g48250, chloroplastic [Mercurialis annua]